MKKILFAAALMVSAAGSAMAQNIDIHLGGSGYYGRIDLGDLGRPPVIYREPLIVERVVNYQRMEPAYLRVPAGHAKKWSKHCHKYDACGRPVYFVQDSWYSNTYAPRYRESHRGYGDDRGRGKDYDKDRREAYKEAEKDRREHDKEERKDRREFMKEREKDRREYEKDREKERKEYYKEHKKDRH